LVRLEAFRIGDSPPAPLLGVIAGPNPETKQIGDQKKELAERHRLRLEFWTGLLERAKKRTSLHASISPSTQNYISAGAGKYGLSFWYAIRLKDSGVGLFIDQGDATTNKRIFDQLHTYKEGVETSFGGSLEWVESDQRRSYCVGHRLDKGSLQDTDRWPEIQDAMVDAMIRLDNALRPHVKSLHT